MQNTIFYLVDKNCEDLFIPISLFKGNFEKFIVGVYAGSSSERVSCKLLKIEANDAKSF